jgi:ribonuclease I
MRGQQTGCLLRLEPNKQANVSQDEKRNPRLNTSKNRLFNYTTHGLWTRG